jgi:phytanoyl-CoA dioxygenase PhyH
MTHRKLLGMMRDPTLWRSLAPKLAIEGSGRGLVARTLEGSEEASLQCQLRKDGYFQIGEIFDPLEVARIEEGLSAITGAGWPAPFIFLFDEPWLVYARLDSLLRALLGPQYRSLAAFFAWSLEKSDGASGWGPHRDHAVRTVGDSGDPDSITLWVPITEATPDNGCIHLLPASRDPNYWDHLEQCGSTTLQDVRALPAQAGSVLGWSHQLLHWGGRATPNARNRRMSLSAEFQRGEGLPLDMTLENRFPTFAERLALVGKQLIAYKHMQRPSAQLLDLAQQLVEGTRYASDPRI